MHAPEQSPEKEQFWTTVEDCLRKHEIRPLDVGALSYGADILVYLTNSHDIASVVDTILSDYGARNALRGAEVDGGGSRTLMLLGSKIVGINYDDPASSDDDEDEQDDQPIADQRSVMSPEDTEAAYQEMRRRIVVDTPMDQPHGKWSIWAHVHEIVADIERETGQRYVLRDMDEFGALFAVMDDHKQNWIDRAGEIARHLLSDDPTLLTANRDTRIEAIRTFMRSEDLHCASNVTAGTVATEFNRLVKAGELDDYRLL